jgi:hypothetical protein
MDDYERECVDVALGLAEELLMDAPIHEVTKEVNTRIVDSRYLLRIVQELNACLKGKLWYLEQEQN